MALTSALYVALSWIGVMWNDHLSSLTIRHNGSNTSVLRRNGDA